MKYLKWYLKLCFIFLKMSAKSMISYYRWSYLAIYVSHIFQYLSVYIVIWATMQMFNMLDGFGINEIVFLYSLDLLSYSIAQFIFQRFWWIDESISDGTFDEYLIRPVSPFLLFIGKNAHFGYLGHITVSMVVLMVSITQMGISINFVLLLIMIAGAVMIQSAITIIPACLAFVFIKADQLSSMFRIEVRQYIMYPITIYPGFVKVALTVIVPMAFINYYPAVYLLGKEANILFYDYIPVMVVFVGLLSVGISAAFWKFGLKSYKSSGS